MNIWQPCGKFRSTVYILSVSSLTKSLCQWFIGPLGDIRAVLVLRQVELSPIDQRVYS
jgi:hypothetical protein